MNKGRSRQALLQSASPELNSNPAEAASRGSLISTSTELD
jgi:hypothetical protein